MDFDETWQVGLRPERLSLARFQRNRAVGFGESAKMGRRGVVFCQVNDAPLLPLGLISAKLSMNTYSGGGSRHMVSYSRSFH